VTVLHNSDETHVPALLTVKNVRNVKNVQKVQKVGKSESGGYTNAQFCNCSSKRGQTVLRLLFCGKVNAAGRRSGVPRELGGTQIIRQMVVPTWYGMVSRPGPLPHAG